MRERWQRIGVLAAVLFAINVVARLVARLAFSGNDGWETNTGLISMTVIGLIFVALAFRWGRDRPAGILVADLAGAAAAGCLLTIFIGPFISGEGPFSDGAGIFFAQIWQYVGFFGGGTLIGFLLLTALGLDYKSKSLKQIAQSGVSRPRRVARR